MAEDKLGSIWKLREWVDTNFNGGLLADKLGNLIDNVSYEVNSKLAKMEEKQKDSVELPKDKNGRTIHPGDAIVVYGSTKNVDCLVLHGDGQWRAKYQKGWNWLSAIPEEVEVYEPTIGERIERATEEIIMSPRSIVDDCYQVNVGKIGKLCDLVHELNSKESK